MPSNKQKNSYGGTVLLPPPVMSPPKGWPPPKQSLNMNAPIDGGIQEVQALMHPDKFTRDKNGRLIPILPMTVIQDTPLEAGPPGNFSFGMPEGQPKVKPGTTLWENLEPEKPPKKVVKEVNKAVPKKLVEEIKKPESPAKKAEAVPTNKAIWELKKFWMDDPGDKKGPDVTDKLLKDAISDQDKARIMANVQDGYAKELHNTVNKPGHQFDPRPYMASVDALFDTRLMERFEKYLPPKPMTDKQKLEYKIKMQDLLMKGRRPIAQDQINLLKAAQTGKYNEELIKAKGELGFRKSMDAVNKLQAKANLEGKEREWQSGRDELNFRHQLDLQRLRNRGQLDAARLRGSLAEDKPPTPAQGKEAGYGRRVESGLGTMRQLFANHGLEHFTNNNAAIERMRPGWPKAISKKEEFRKMDQAERNIVNAILRPESGAVISEEEFDNATKQYFPRSGDSPEVVEQKLRNIEMVIRKSKVISGKAWDMMNDPIQLAPFKPSPETAGIPGQRTEKMKALDEKARRLHEMRRGGK